MTFIYCQYLVCLFNETSNFINELYNTKAILIDKPQRYCSWWKMGVHTFRKGISPKMNVIVQLKFKLTYFEVTAHHINHYATGSPSIFISNSQLNVLVFGTFKSGLNRWVAKLGITIFIKCFWDL